MTHSLTNIDPAEMAGDCSICGEKVPVQRVSTKGPYFACRTARREARRNYRLAHPSRIKAEHHKYRKSAHLLERGVCAVCGPVQTVTHGRGVMCGNRAAELGWVSRQTTQERCWICATWMRSDGTCPRCDDRGEDLGHTMMLAEYGQRGRPAPWWTAEGLWLTPESPLPQGVENAVPGWKTIGARA